MRTEAIIASGLWSVRLGLSCSGSPGKSSVSHKSGVFSFRADNSSLQLIPPQKRKAINNRIFVVSHHKK